MGEVDKFTYGSEVAKAYNYNVVQFKLKPGNFAAFDKNLELVAQGKTLDELIKNMGKPPRQSYSIANPYNLEAPK